MNLNNSDLDARSGEQEDELDEWDDDEDEVLTRFLHDAIWFSVLWSPHPAPTPSPTRPALELDVDSAKPIDEAGYAAVVVYNLNFAGSPGAFSLIRNLRVQLSAYRDRGFEPVDVARDILTKYPGFGGRVSVI
jgi:hypothetical protein